MRGARYYRPDVPTRLLKCSEKLLRNCDGETEQCCKVVPCEYCLTFTTEDYPVEYGIASGSTTWTGEVADAAFYAYWEKLEGVCYFVVRLNGVEVSRSNCTQTECRDSSATAEVVIGGKAGVLRWEKRLHHPLQYVTDQNTNCQTHFCGDCECTCETLCVVVTEPPPDPAYPEAPDVRLDPYSCDGLLPMDCGFCDAVPDENTTYGELPNTEEDACKRPVWQNTVAERFITVFLSRAEYTGECLLNGVVDGEHFGPEAVSDCKNITASWTKADGTKIDVSCKQCGCDTGTPPDAGACCDLIPCAFCVQYEVYGEEPIRVYIEYGSGQWYGSIGGVTVLMYWYVNSYGECAFVVEYGGEVVYEKTIAEGQSCENPTDFIEVPYGVLSWTIHPLSPMKRQDEDTPFCGACDCTSECICITVTDPPDRVGGARTYNGEVCVDDYDECDDPLWAGNVGGREIEITLLPDRVTNQCVLVIDIDGEVFDLDVFVCNDLSFSVELYDGTVVTGASKLCACENNDPLPCCPGFPAPDTLECDVTLNAGDCSCFALVGGSYSVTLYLVNKQPNYYEYHGIRKRPSGCNAGSGASSNVYDGFVFICRNDATEGAELSILFEVSPPAEPQPSLPISSSFPYTNWSQGFQPRSVNTEDCVFPLFIFEYGDSHALDACEADLDTDVTIVVHA